MAFPHKNEKWMSSSDHANAGKSSYIRDYVWICRIQMCIMREILNVEGSLTKPRCIARYVQFHCLPAAFWHCPTCVRGLHNLKMYSGVLYHASYMLWKMSDVFEKITGYTCNSLRPKTIQYPSLNHSESRKNLPTRLKSCVNFAKLNTVTRVWLRFSVTWSPFPPVCFLRGILSRDLRLLRNNRHLSQICLGYFRFVKWLCKFPIFRSVWVMGKGVVGGVCCN